MSDTVISVENISKLYRLGEVGTGTLSHDFNRWWHLIRGKEDPYLKIGQVNDETNKAISSFEDPISTSSDYVYALKDVSFEVKRGEVLGIIGRNGAGKSTLLKILSRVTIQTEGQIKVKGRIASLLEVGTGFHPDLTGRENIYLNGVILGMRKHEITRKFDEIIDFSGVEHYIDTPVKRYSSGMYVRLAFAVAAHLDPEILIIDEVLAVGDGEFQKKCLGKIGDVSREGRTVLFVSHNMAAINNLCTTTILINKGNVVEKGSPTEMTKIYFRMMAGEGSSHKNGKFLYWVRLDKENTRAQACIATGDAITFRILIAPPESMCLVSLIIKNSSMEPLFELFDHAFSPPCTKEAVPVEIEVATESSLRLLPGTYHVDYWMGNRVNQLIERVNDVLTFEVVAGSKSQTSLSLAGSLECKSDWRSLSGGR
jgi:lipopolysaccharide transport system ATP-binding protein